MKYAVYVRVASGLQTDIDKSVNKQMAATSKYLESKGIIDFDIFIDYGSGGPNQCKGFKSMCGGIKNGDYSVIITTDLSRITRNLNQYNEFLATLLENDVLLNLVNGGVGLNKGSVATK